MYDSSKPVKKVGRDTPAVVTSRHSWSIQLPGLVAASTPSGNAMAQASSSARNTSSSDAGRRASSSCATGWPVVSDRPMSPRANAPR